MLDTCIIDLLVCYSIIEFIKIEPVHEISNNVAF